MEEALEMIVALLDGERLDFEGRVRSTRRVPPHARGAATPV